MRLVDTVNRKGSLGPAISIGEAHRLGTVHRAVSILVWNDSRTKMLITRRADAKETWPGFWSNAVCSHPLPREPYVAAARRRLFEELRIRRAVARSFRMRYGPVRCPVSGLFEHELDHVFFVKVPENLSIKPNRAEISALRWVDRMQLDDLRQSGNITPWFAMMLKRLGWGG
jgi:isopentenyl-diphosphate delta-isomerase